MVVFTTTILQFGQQGEKTGWTYISIPGDIAEKLKPGNKKSFRVQGTLDAFRIAGVALIPMGGGEFIMPLNASLRKSIHKKKGSMLRVRLEIDSKKPVINKALLDCLRDSPEAHDRFKNLPPSHQLYYSKWIESAKTSPTKTKRTAMAVRAMETGMTFAQMLRMSGQL